MRPNPLFATGIAPTEAPATGTQLKIAARGKENVRDVSHGEWRRTLDAVKETLATLGRTCESAIETHEAGVAVLIERLVGTLAQAESERNEAQRVSQQIVSEAESQVQALRAESDAQKAELSLVRQQLETEKAGRSRLMATFQSVQRALSFAQSGDVALEPVTPAESRPQDKPADQRSDAAPARADLQSSPVADAQVLVVEPHPEAVEYVKRLLDEAEAMYLADLKSGRSPVEVVDRLTGILRYARDLVVRCSGFGECDAGRLFEQQITMLLDSKAETSFGRHLSISAYALSSPASSGSG
ncbi:MAG: hypothetical protein LC753_01110 [Acidobacteria bacterium]|nr:hypothetical protein [Acidobacteriota bacterium]MCA1648910.1 hypothetical protein [Acidobacteriota bacterium]